MRALIALAGGAASLLRFLRRLALAAKFYACLNYSWRLAWAKAAR